MEKKIKTILTDILVFWVGGVCTFPTNVAEIVWSSAWYILYLGPKTIFKHLTMSRDE